MGKGIFKRKRTRLIALLAAACAFLAVGIGVGAAAASRAATAKREAAASSASLHRKIRVIDPAKASRDTVLSSVDNPCSTTYTASNYYGSCTSPKTYSAFNSSAYVNQLVVTGQIYGGWAGENFDASVNLGAGIAMPIAGVEGLWNGSNFVNPNSLTPGELEEAMLEGGYMGGIMASAVWSGVAYPFLGGVEYNGQLNSSMVTNGASTISGSLNGTGYTSAPESLQYLFQDDCNNSELLYNTFFSSMAAESTPQLEATVAGLVFGKAAAEGFAKTGKLPQTPQDYYNDYASVLVDGKKVNEMGGLYGEYLASYDKISSTTVTSDLNSMYNTGLQLVSDVPTFQQGMKDYTSTAGDLIDALNTAQQKYYQLWSEYEADGHGGNFGITETQLSEAKKAYSDAINALNPARSAYLKAVGTASTSTQPLLCLAAWNYNVGYTSFPTEEDFYGQGSISPASPSGSADAPEAYWGIGPAYEGSSTAADGTLSMDVTGTATSFLYSVLGGDSNTTPYSNSGVYLMAFYNTNQTSGSYSQNGATVTVNVKPVEGGGTLSANGTWLQISFASLGQTPTEVNPTSLPSGVTLSPSSPASDGLYFKAVSQSGEPLKSVKMELDPDWGDYYGAWGGGSTPLYPMTNGAAKGVTSDIWPNIGQTYWAGYNANSFPGGPQTASGYSGYGWAQFTAKSVLNSSGSPTGWFDFSGVGAGDYTVVILSGTTANGDTVSYGSYYDVATFQIDASTYSSPETITPSDFDACGFIDPSQDEVVVGAENPSSSIIQGAVAPKNGTSDPYTATVGSSNPFTYQAEAYMPLDLSGQEDASLASASSSPLSFEVSSLPQGEQIVPSSVEVNGIPLSTLGSSLTSSSSAFSFSLSPSQISTLQSSGFEPYPNQADKLTSSSGQVDRVLAVTWKAYLDSSFTSPGSPTFEFSYKAYTTSDNNQKTLALTPQVSTNGPASNSVPSSLSTTEDSSSTGLWFKDLDPDGSASSGAKFMVQNSSGNYLEEDTSSGAFTGWSWTSTPSASTEFSQKNVDAVFSFGGLENGTYTVIQVAWPSSMGTSAAEGSGENNWPGISPDLKAGGPDWAGYPGHLGGKAGYDGSFQVALSYSSPESMSTQADPAGLVDASSDQIYSLSPIKMAPIVNSSLSSQAYQTETVGVPFTEGWEGYLPMANTSPASAGGTYYSSSMQVAINENVNGLEMLNPSTSNIEVASIPLSTLVENGALATSGASPASASDTVYTITLPYKALQYIEENGKNAEGEPLSSSSNRLIVISFPAKMETSFKEGGTFQQWMALGGITVSNSQADASNAWWTQNPGSDWYVSSSPLYTNGTSDNSLPSSLSMSSPSSSTGLWFKSLWWGSSNPATGAKFTVSQTQGGKTVYLTPEETSGKFSGWSWQDSPYDFSEQDSDADFSFGGLANGTYTVTEVDPAAGATSSSLSFTGALSYSSPEALTSLSDPLNLLSPKEGIVYNVVIPSHLPFTGGRWVLILSAAAVLLFGAGAAIFLLRKRRA